MVDPEDFGKLLEFFKALGNESRLKIVALLAERDYTVRELAQRLDLKEPTVSEHLAMLKQAGLVNVEPDGNHRIYSFNARNLIDMNRDLLSRDQLASFADTVKDDDITDAQDRDVLKNYLDGERLTTIPSSRKKLMVVLRWLADQFEYGRRYPEKEVNAIINRHHMDHATLRRELIGYELLRREKGIYWRPEPEETS
jgi:DNA-binding transcriptional ArsR family regulator